MNTIEKIRTEIERLKEEFVSIQPRDVSLNQIKKFAGYRYLDKVLSFLATLEEEPVEIHPIFRVGDYVRNRKTKDKVLIEQLDMENKTYFYFSWDGAAEIHSDFSFSKQNEWELIGQTVADEKPIELEKEIKSFATNFYNEKDAIPTTADIARHFYNLGRQSGCVKVKAESALNKFISENCIHCSIEHCPGVKACYTSSNKQLQ